MQEPKEILEAYSTRFKDVPASGFAKGALLRNRRKSYLNIGDAKKAKWEIIKPKNNG